METLAIVDYFGLQHYLESRLQEIEQSLKNSNSEVKSRQHKGTLLYTYCRDQTFMAKTKTVTTSIRLRNSKHEDADLKLYLNLLLLYPIWVPNWIENIYTMVIQQNHQCVAYRLDVVYFCDCAFLLNNFFRNKWDHDSNLCHIKSQFYIVHPSETGKLLKSNIYCK